MNWTKVADYLDHEGFALQQQAETRPDQETRQDMRLRAAIFITLGEALKAGIESKDAVPA